MHDIWNPWHGCRKISEGCKNCYMYYLDKKYSDANGAIIYKSKNNFEYPLKKDRQGEYKIKAGEQIRVCMTSDFFLEEADEWRMQAWDIIKKRSDVKFFILTKRANRIKSNLPSDWNEGYENVILNVTAENQKRADERIPILLDIKAKHKGVMVAPFIDKVDIEKYLKTGQIEQVICGGENYDGSRICNFDWVKKLSKDCIDNNVTFCFMETGTNFVKDDKLYHLKSKKIQSNMAYKSGVNFIGKKVKYIFKDSNDNIIDESKLYKPHFKEHCMTCGGKLTCNGCSNCGKCGQ